MSLIGMRVANGINDFVRNIALPLYNTAKSWLAPSDDLSKASFLSGLNNQFTGNLDYQRQLELMDKEMAFNSSEAQKVREHNEYLSSTQYQRAVEDMRKAGLNPYLVYNNGGNDIVSSSNASIGSRYSSGSGKSGFSMISSLASQLIRGQYGLAIAQTNANANVLSSLIRSLF